MPSPSPRPGIPPVVLIDDEQVVGTIMRRLIGETGFRGQFLVYQDAGSALTFLAQASAGADRHPGLIPSLILVDIRMPTVDGLEVIRWVRDHPRLTEVKLVVLSASNSQVDRDDALAAGTDYYLTKYPTAQTLKALVEWSTGGGELPVA